MARIVALDAVLQNSIVAVAERPLAEVELHSAQPGYPKRPNHFRIARDPGTIAKVTRPGEICVQIISSPVTRF
jgi:hypothetical protein